MSGCEEGQDVNIAVPEDVPAISSAAKASCANRCFTKAGDRTHQMEQSEPDRMLQLWIAIDPNVGACPAPSPVGSVRRQEAVETFGFHLGQGPDRRLHTRAPAWTGYVD